VPRKGATDVRLCSISVGSLIFRHVLQAPDTPCGIGTAKRGDLAKTYGSPMESGNRLEQDVASTNTRCRKPAKLAPQKRQTRRSGAVLGAESGATLLIPTSRLMCLQPRAPVRALLLRRPRVAGWVEAYLT
jgi:hypothetical protein